MSWAALDDRWWNHPKVLSVSPAARALHVAAISYCAQQLTDGVVRQELLPALLPGGDAPAAAEELVRARLLERTEHGLLVHDYLAYNPTRAEVELRRELQRKGGKDGAARRWGRMGIPIGQPIGRPMGGTHLESSCSPSPSPSPSPPGGASPPSTPQPSPSATRAGLLAIWNRIAEKAGLPSHRLVPKSLASDLDTFYAEARTMKPAAPEEVCEAAFSAAAHAYSTMDGHKRYGLPNLLRRANRAKWLAAFGSSTNGNGNPTHTNPPNWRSVEAQMANLPPLEGGDPE